MTRPPAYENRGQSTRAILPPKDQNQTVEGLFALAVDYQQRAENEKALSCYRKAIAADPKLAPAFYNSGVILYGQRQWDASIQYFKQALTLKPDFLDAAFNLAAAYKEAGQYRLAAKAYRKVVAQDPTLADAFFYMGTCHLKMGQLPSAIDALRRAAQLDPHNPQYWFHLAEAHFMIQSNKDAVACYRKALALKPDWDSSHYNLAVVLRMEQHLGDAIAHLKQAVEINPAFSQAHAFLFRLAQHTCDWPLAAEMDRHLDELTPAELARGLKCAESPMTSIRRSADVRLNLQVAASWSRHIARQVAASKSSVSFTPIMNTRQRIRIGYLSNDFKDHAVAHQIRGMLEQHNRQQFEIFGYATNPDDGTAYRHLLARACDHFRELDQLSDPAAAQQIHADGIQILVDMAGHSRNNRLGIAALRPAPIQVSYLGFLGTTGADFIDYILADTVVIPKEHVPYYSEKIVYLPHCYQANDDQMPIAKREKDRSDFNLLNEDFVYCSFNQPYKIDANLFHMWMDILKQVDNSVLWLVERSPLARENLRLAAKKVDIDPSRLIFAVFVPLEQNLARLQCADLVLDTLAYNGGATTSNALWAGVPVLTTLGRHWVSRMSASALNAMGIQELIAKDLEDYGRIAVELALNPHKLETLRERLWSRRSTAPLFDTQLFARHIEKAFTRMWHCHVQGLTPASFRIQA